MNDIERLTEIRYNQLKNDGVSNPVKVDDFVEEIYALMKERDFSIIESEWIVKYLLGRIDTDKKTILREPLKETEKYNKEDCREDQSSKDRKGK